jgi:hypothetical protein
MSLNDYEDKRDYKQAEVEHTDHARRPSLGVSAGAEASGTINPLHGVPKATLLADVENFCSEYNLSEHTDTFKAGALVAQNPAAFEDIPEVSEEDKVWLRTSAANKWSHPKLLFFTVMACAIGAATQGWDQTGSNGANLSFPTEFGLNHEIGTAEGNKDEWIVGLVNSAPYISSALLCVYLYSAQV